MEKVEILDTVELSIESQAILNAMPGSNNNLIHNDLWSFNLNNDSALVIDFTFLRKIEICKSEEIKKLNIDIVWVSKILWLRSMSPKALAYGKIKLRSLALFWTALVNSQAASINSKNVLECIIFFLTNRWGNSGPVARKGMLSYGSYSYEFPIDSWRQTFHSLNLNLISPTINSAQITKVLRSAIGQLTSNELTYADWTKGKGYNLLTLDHGQYYVDYCLSFFSKRIALATALASTIRAIPAIARQCKRHETYIGKWITQFLLGSIPSDLVLDTKDKGKRKTLNQVYQAVLLHFRSEFITANLKSIMLKQDSISSLLKSLKLEPTLPQIDRFRHIVWNWLNFKDIGATTALLNSTNPPVSFSSFENAINARATYYADDEFFLPNEPTYRALGLPPPPNDAYNSWYPKELIRLVECAGLINIVALTGWRRSEYGFPMSALKSFANDDLLDQYAFPLRYQVDWYIYKTNGRVRERREITFAIAVIAQQLQALHGVSDQDPCLYAPTSTKKDRFNSGTAVTRAMPSVWKNFVENYPPFKTLTELELWRKIGSKTKHQLTMSDISEGNRLLAIRKADDWNNFKEDPIIKSAWIKARQDLEVLEFYFFPNANSSKINWVDRYRQKTLAENWIELLDKSLSESTREWIHTMDSEACRDGHTTKTLSGELIADCLYPTPHAFRHMWAEAVYRRFDGDAGWMIRSHFKHISKRMWLEYIKDKDNRIAHTESKNRVINSLVSNHFTHQGAGYAGLMHKWLRRLARQTVILLPEEQRQFIDKIAAVEIIDIKTNPFGYCLLKKRSKHLAKCAVKGEPQRHNASPDLCLGCAHNLMQSGNLDWLLLYGATHLEALRNPVVPEIFKRSSAKLLKKISSHLRQSDPTHPALAELTSTLIEFT